MISSSHQSRRYLESASTALFTLKRSNAALICSVLFAVVVLIDIFLPPELNIVFAYLFIVALTTWNLGPAAGVVVAILASLSQIGGQLSHPLVYSVFWYLRVFNGAFSFLVVLLLTWALRRLYETVRARESALAVSNQRMRALSSRVLSEAENERRKVVHELQQVIGHSLTTLEFELASMQFNASDVLPRSARCREVVAQLQGQIDSLSATLRPSELDDFGLAAAIRVSIDRFRHASGLNATLTLPREEAPLSADVQTACFRIFQEALTNILSHAGAKNGWVEMRHTEGSLILEVRDDGVGFDADAAIRAPREGTMGLRNMRDRAVLVGGTVKIRSEVGLGTEIQAQFPLG